MGGTLAAIEGGFQQRQIQEAAYRVQRAIESGDQVVVGVNRSATTRSHDAADSSGSTRTGERRQVERRPAGPGRARPPRPGRPRWTGSRRRARGDGQPACRRSSTAVQAYATVGEISDRLRAAWGEHRELITV